MEIKSAKERVLAIPSPVHGESQPDYFEEFMRGIRLAILKDTEGKISMEWAEKWFAQCWAAAQLDPSPQREVSKNHPLATSPAPPKAETEVKG